MRLRHLIAFLAAVALVTAATFVALYMSRPRIPAEQYAWIGSSQADALAPLWEAPQFRFPDQTGRMVDRTTLAGRPWIADFFFTTCTTICPVMTAKLVLLQRELAGVDVRFVSFSVDPAHDTPAALATYATTWNAEERRWHLLATTPQTLAEAVQGFHVTAEPDTDRANPIMHSSVFLLIDGTGWIRGVYDSGDDTALKQLTRDARRLAAEAASQRTGAGSAPPPVPEPTPTPPGMAGTGGSSLYRSLGCAGCHENPRVAPALGGLPGATVRLQDGMTLVADAAYVRRSILEPGAEVVAGYVPIMPSYRGVVSGARLDQLVEEITALPGARTESATADVRLTIDPVCDMTVRADSTTLHAPFGRHMVFFCCEACRDEFLSTPVRYLAKVARADSMERAAAEAELRSPKSARPRTR